MSRSQPIKVVVHDKMQQHYSYWLTEPSGRNFSPDFKPELTPKQMLSLGVFCGRYMRDCQQEFPCSWFKTARFSQAKPNCDLNYYRIKASMPLSYWQKNDWIHPQDPRGWFQWYCRYYRGRRSADDERQIKRWRMMRRHVAQIKKNCPAGDMSCRRRQRQALIQWAYDASQY
ncbi:MAG: hypothetical protein ACKKL5_01490 [Candidatus Komeilibacteria bacterium]